MWQWPVSGKGVVVATTRLGPCGCHNHAVDRVTFSQVCEDACHRKQCRGRSGDDSGSRDIHAHHQAAAVNPIDNHAKGADRGHRVGTGGARANPA
jgi:hypothetical protein